MKKLVHLIFKYFGWQMIYPLPEPQKSVICLAPHTSNWDFVIGELSYWLIGRKASFLIKKSWFVFPLNFFFKSLGGIPIDRSRRNSLTQQMIDKFQKLDSFHLVITPEGTRSHVTAWKKGFYYIALGAYVPIQLSYIDYKKKELGIAKNFYPTGNIDADFQEIQNFYENVQPKYPEKYNKKIF